jgi:hypothetical protein
MSKNTYATYSIRNYNNDIIIYDSSSQTKDPYKFKSNFAPLVEFAGELLKDKSQKPHGNVYTATTCKIPRDKMKVYFQENNLKKTTRTYLADTVLIDLESLDKVLRIFPKQHSWTKGFMIPSEDVVKNSHLFDIDHNRNNSWSQPYFTIHDQVLKGEYDVFIKTYDDRATQIVKSSFPEAEKIEILSYPTGDLLKTLELLTFLKSHPNITVVFDTTLNEGMTNEGIEMDDEIEKQVMQMLKSTDINDTKMAIEICSNFDLEKSLFRIAFMFNKHKNCFIGKQSMLTKTSYKQIDAYIRSKGIGWMSDRDTFLSDMFVLYKDDEKITPIIKRHIQDYLQSQLKHTKIKLTDISLA